MDDRPGPTTGCQTTVPRKVVSMNSKKQHANRKLGLLWIILVVVALLAGGFVGYQTLNTRAPDVVSPQAVVRAKIPPLPDSAKGNMAPEPTMDKGQVEQKKNPDDAAGSTSMTAKPSFEEAGAEPSMALQTDASANADSEADPQKTPSTGYSDTGTAGDAPIVEADATPSMAVPKSDDSLNDDSPAALPHTAQPQPPHAMASNKVQPPAPYAIQVGAFRNKTYAEQTAEQLKDKGYDSYIFETKGKNGRPWYLVRFGHFQDRPAAAKALTIFKDQEQMTATIARSRKK